MDWCLPSNVFRSCIYIEMFIVFGRNSEKNYAAGSVRSVSYRKDERVEWHHSYTREIEARECAWSESFMFSLFCPSILCDWRTASFPPICRLQEAHSLPSSLLFPACYAVQRLHVFVYINQRDTFSPRGGPGEYILSQLAKVRSTEEGDSIFLTLSFLPVWILFRVDCCFYDSCLEVCPSHCRKTAKITKKWETEPQGSQLKTKQFVVEADNCLGILPRLLPYTYVRDDLMSCRVVNLVSLPLDLERMREQEGKE